MRSVHLAIAPLQSKYTEYQVLAISGLWFVSGLQITVLPNKPHHAPIGSLGTNVSHFIRKIPKIVKFYQFRTILKLSKNLTLSF